MGGWYFPGVLDRVCTGLPVLCSPDCGGNLGTARVEVQGTSAIGRLDFRLVAHLKPTSAKAAKKESEYLRGA